MDLDAFLNRLDKCIQTGDRKWKACCPAHDDRDPSLSITEGDDGKILVHCFAGCTAQDIAQSLGLRVTDFFREDQFNRFMEHNREPPGIASRHRGDKARRDGDKARDNATANQSYNGASGVWLGRERRGEIEHRIWFCCLYLSDVIAAIEPNDYDTVTFNKYWRQLIYYDMPLLEQKGERELIAKVEVAVNLWSKVFAPNSQPLDDIGVNNK